MSTYRGLEEEKSCSWEEKAKILGCFFKNLTKSLVNGNGLRDCEQTWNSLQRYINIFSSKYGYTKIEYTLQEKKPYLYSPIGVWLKIALAILIYNITS